MELLTEHIPTSVQIDGEWENKEVYVDGKRLNPGPSIKLRNHSPDGFAWGYGGSGPAQLALAILLRFFSDNIALALYQDFKFKVVAAWPQEDFDVTINLQEIITEITNKNSL